MFAAILSAAKTWLLDDPDNTIDLSDLDEAEVQQKIDEVERKTTEIQEQLISLRDRYQSAVERAEHVHGPELDTVRSKLAVVLKHTASTRATLHKTLREEFFLHQISVAKRSDTSFTGLNVDPAKLPQVIRDPLWADLLRDSDTPPIDAYPEPTLGDHDAWAEHELGDVEACIDEVVNAARSDDPVPSLSELFAASEDEFDISPHQGRDDRDSVDADRSTRETDTRDGLDDDENGVTDAGQE